jgi:hypothetical protein
MVELGELLPVVAHGLPDRRFMPTIELAEAFAIAVSFESGGF